MSLASSSPTPTSTLGEFVSAFAGFVDDFEPGTLHPTDAAAVAGELGRLKRMANGLELLCLNQAAATAAVRNRHDPDGAKWAGQQLGTSPGHAAELLLLADGLGEAPNTRQALLGGEISTEQAAEVVRTEKAAPGTERDMLHQAGRGSLTELKRRGRKVRAAATDAEEKARQIHRGRHLRTWTDDDGAGRGSWSLPPAEHAQVLAILAPLTDRIFDDARKEGRHEPVDAYRADALVRLATHAISAGPGPRGRTSSTHPVSTHRASTGPGSTIRGSTPSGSTDPGSSGASAIDPGLPLADGEDPNINDGRLPHARSPGGDAADHPPGSSEGPALLPGSQATGVASSHGVRAAQIVVRVGHRALTDAAMPRSSLLEAARSGVPPRPDTGAQAAGDRTVDDVAEVVGVGPVATSQVLDWLAQGAFVVVIVTPDDDPSQIRSVLHLGSRSPLVDRLWRRQRPSSRAGPDRDTPTRHVKILVRITDTELRTPGFEALAAAIATRGTDITTLVHRGRRPNAAQRSALQWRSPECAVVGCPNLIRLEVDHVVEWRLTHHTTLDELEHLCRHHHRMKTHDGYRLEPGSGKRRLLPPPEP